MSAFDTSTNTASVSFTNAYATAVLQPSAMTQQVFGFERTTGKRYFEFYVNDGGGTYLTTDKPYVGILGYGTSSNLLGPLVPGGATISTGDVFMFSVDFGGGTDHAGNVKYTTITGAGGNLLSPVYVDIGKNGTWNTDLWGLVGWKYPAYGKTGGQKPALYRIATSTSAVTMSLRVEDSAFTYTVPAGFVAWGDGPEGGTAQSTLTDAGVYWDPARTSAHVSLSGNNLYAVIDGTYTYTSTNNSHFFYTTALPSTGQRVIETIARRNAAPFPIGPIGIGLADEDVSITSPMSVSTKKIGKGWSYTSWYQRGAVHTTSITTGSEGYDLYGEQPGLMLFVDFDNGRYWQTGGLMTGVGLYQRSFIGDVNPGSTTYAALCDPFLGNDGMTFTNSIGMRLCMEQRKDSNVQGAAVYLNVGQTAFETFPQLPGWISMNGGRRVYGVGAKWDTTQAQAGSTTFYASDLAVRTARANVFQGTTSKNAGKYYFEIFKQAQETAFDFVGVRLAGETSMSATSTACWAPSGLWFSRQDSRKLRYGTATSWTCTNSRVHVTSSQNRYGIAIDFDLGNIWCGVWNFNDRQMNWAPGADPAAGTLPDMTFTASTTFVIGAVTQGGGINGGNIMVLVAEDTNVIGLPTGFDTWNGTTSVTASSTATPSGGVVGGGSGRVLWPYGVQT